MEYLKYLMGTKTFRLSLIPTVLWVLFYMFWGATEMASDVGWHPIKALLVTLVLGIISSGLFLMVVSAILWALNPNWNTK